MRRIDPARLGLLAGFLLLPGFAGGAGPVPGQTGNAPDGQAPSPHPFRVFLDPAHGGSDTGAMLSPRSAEKTLALELAGQLRALLAGEGVEVLLSREGDTNPTPGERAEAADTASPAACLSLHATATGAGVHLFTTSLAPAPEARVPLPWDTAQAFYATDSLKLSSAINTALAHAAVPVTLARTSLSPLDSFTCPAVALEVAPLPASGSEAAAAAGSPAYQARVARAVVAALLEWRRQWRQP